MQDTLESAHNTKNTAGNARHCARSHPARQSSAPAMQDTEK